MAVGLSVTAQSLLKSVGIQPQMVLDLEGIDTIYASRPVFKTLEWDEETASWDDEKLFWDGSIADSNSVDWISLKGTTTSISQQIRPDKGSTSSISTVNIAIVDVDGKVSKALSFDNITEILGRKATFSIGFANQSAVYPEDYQRVFIGVVVDFYTESGIVMVSLASPETLKRQVFLEKFQGETTADINNSITTIPVNDTVGIYASQDSLTTYIRIEDELMEVASFTATTIDVIRAQLNTVPTSHDIIEFETFYRLQGEPLDLARKIMLSDEGNTYFDSLDIPKSINFVSVTESLVNSIVFDYYDIKEKTGLVVGDSIQLNSPPNTGTYTIREFGQLDSGDSFIGVNEILVDESDYINDFSYKSQWNVLPTGLGMLTSEVDVDEFNNIAAAFSSNFVDYDIYIKDSIDDAKEFLDKEIFFPQGLFSIPRKARSSVKFVVPPFSSAITPTLNNSAITNITKIKQRRSIHKYLYNTYVWRFNQDSIEDKFLTGKIVVSANSINRIKAGKKQLKIESAGLRNNPSTIALVNNISQRLIDRYQFAPTYFEGVEVNYKTGYTIEVGDIVPAFPSETKTKDLKDGSNQVEKLYEVVNKSLNVKTGKISLSLLSSAFEIESRYVVVSLSSKATNDSTNSRLIIEPINDLGQFPNPTAQWKPLEGNRIRVRSNDYTDDEIVEFNVDPNNSSALLLSDALSFAPNENHIVEVPSYEDSDAAIDSDYKLQFGYQNSLVKVTSVISATSFEVDLPNSLFTNSLIYVNAKDYSETSFEELIRIESIVGNLVTLESALPFVPQVDYIVNRSNFGDDGFSYVFI